MRDLDETDVEILALLAADGRRAFSEIGETVGLSGPAVSDRVTRLQESGVIERFTVELDRSALRGGVPLFVRVERVAPDAVDPLCAVLRETEAVEHVFVTADGGVWFAGRADARTVRRWVEELLAEAGVESSFEVTLVDDAEWTPTLEGTQFALTCAECGNTVDSEGESARLDETVYQFCCGSCRGRFEERHDRFSEAA